MKFYDMVVSLGQYCMTSLALRSVHLQEESNVFDWSAGHLQDMAGKGGLAGKVDLICNDFKNFFNFEDFYSKGPNKESDQEHLWVVNKKTGLQYQHDFLSSMTLEDSYPDVYEKYMRRVSKLYKNIEHANSILFVYIAKDEGFSDDYLIEQQKKLALKFPNKQIDFLYIMQNQTFDEKSFHKYYLTSNVCRIDCNVNHPSDLRKGKDWNGNTDLYYQLLQNFAYTPASLNYYRQVLYHMNYQLELLHQKNDEMKKQMDILVSESLDRKKHNIFSELKEFAKRIYTVKKDNKHHSVIICGLKFSIKRKKYKKVKQ